MGANVCPTMQSGQKPKPHPVAPDALDVMSLPVTSSHRYVQLYYSPKSHLEIRSALNKLNHRHEILECFDMVVVEVGFIK